MNYQRDGAMRVDGNGGAAPTTGRTASAVPSPEPEVAEPPIEVSGQAARQRYTHPNDDFVQAGALFGKVMTDADRDHLVGNLIGHLGGAQKRIQYRQCAVFTKAHQDYGRRVAEGLKLDVQEVAKLAGMSAEDRAKATGPGSYSK